MTYQASLLDNPKRGAGAPRPRQRPLAATTPRTARAAGFFGGLRGCSDRNRVVKLAFEADRARAGRVASWALGRAPGRLDQRSTAGRPGVAGCTATRLARMLHSRAHAARGVCTPARGRAPCGEWTSAGWRIGVYAKDRIRGTSCADVRQTSPILGPNTPVLGVEIQTTLRNKNIFEKVAWSRL